MQTLLWDLVIKKSAAEQELASIPQDMQRCYDSLVQTIGHLTRMCDDSVISETPLQSGYMAVYQERVSLLSATLEQYHVLFSTTPGVVMLTVKSMTEDAKMDIEIAIDQLEKEETPQEEDCDDEDDDVDFETE